MAAGKIMLPVKPAAIRSPKIVPKISGKRLLVIPAVVGKMGP
jgi:hypothetical protein